MPDHPAAPPPPPEAPVFAPPVPSTAPPTLGAFCRACGQGVDPRAVICPKCGVQTGRPMTTTGNGLHSDAKSGSTAVLLSLLMTGAGHWYTGEVGRGFAFLGAVILAAFSVVFMIGFVALPAVWIWAAIDSNQSAQRYNARLINLGGQGL